MKFSVHPNPMHGDLLFVQLPVQENALGNGLATIMDPTGRIVAERNIVLSNGTSSTMFDLGGALVNGTYFLKLTIGKRWALNDLLSNIRIAINLVLQKDRAF